MKRYRIYKRVCVFLFILGMFLGLNGCSAWDHSENTSVFQLLSESGEQEQRGLNIEELQAAEGYENLYILEDGMPDGMTYTDLKPFGSNILLIGEQYDLEGEYDIQYYFCVYNPWEGKIEAALSSEDAGADVYHVAGDELLLYNTDNKKMTVYDMSLTATAVADLSDIMMEDGGVFYSGDELFPLYVCDYYSETVWRLAVKEEMLSMKEMQFPLYNASISGVTLDGEALIITGVEKNTLNYKTVLWDVETQDIIAEAAEGPSAGYFYGGTYDTHIFEELDGIEGIWLNQVLGQEAGYFKLEGYPAVQLLRDNIFSVQDDMQQDDAYCRISLYDTEGRFLSGINYYSGNYSSGQFMNLAQTTFRLGDTDWFCLLSYDLMGRTKLMLWDTSQQGEKGEDLQTVEAPAQEASAALEHTEAALETLYQQAGSLSDSCGMVIRIGEDVPEEIDVYHVAREYDPEIIEAALDTLETILDCYPDGFFDELCFNQITGVTIYLGGAITSEAEGMLQEAGGFVCEENRRILMVLDTANLFNWNYTVNHEISHIIDRRLAFLALCTDTALFSEETWGSYNPEDFSYLETYDGYAENPDYDQYYAYFIDSYGLTFATEDRAEIFGKAMESYLGGYIDPEIFKEDGNIAKKFEYYCACIRNGFSSGAWPDRMPWEEVLENAG